MKQMRIRSKVWLEVDGQPFLGDGRYRLLTAVERTGSISAAARELGMSYRKVWALLQTMEETSPFPILKRRIGGKGGGASQLTGEILELMRGFQQVRDQVNAEADRCFDLYFPWRKTDADLP